jgi:hypothetical protein
LVVVVLDLFDADPLDTIVPFRLYISPYRTIAMDLVIEARDIDERRSSLMPVLMIAESPELPSGVVPDPPRPRGVAAHVASY